MISRSTVIGGLVVVELAILGVAGSALSFSGSPQAGPPIAMGPGSVRMHHGFSLRDWRAGDVSTPLDKSFVTFGSPRIVVDVKDVDVHVETGPAPGVHVTETVKRAGFVGNDDVPLTAEQTADGVRIHGGADHGTFVLGALQRDLRLVVPASARVELTTAGEIDTRGLRTKLIAHTSDGRVIVHDHQGDLDVSSESGRIELTDVQASAIDAVARDGRIYLTRVGADRLQGHSDSGRIIGTGIRVVDGSLTTLDGRIELSFTGTSDATATVHTDDGAIHLNGLGSVDAGDKRRTVRLGSGRGHFEISTGDGPVTITQGANG